MNQPLNRVMTTLKRHPRYVQGAFGAMVSSAITAEYTRGSDHRARKVWIGAGIGAAAGAALKEGHFEKAMGWAESIFG